MPYILQVNFPYNGPWGADKTAAMDGLAQSIANEPGLIWKVWLESQALNEAGGIYLFTDEKSAQAYLEMHSKRLKSFGIFPVESKLFLVNEPLSLINRATLSG